MRASLTYDFAVAVSRLAFEQMPRQGIDIAKRGFIDAVGVMLAGKDEPCVSILAETLSPAPGDASLFWGPGKAGAPEAAWLNAVATHALEFDDTALSAHPSAVLVTAIVGEAETLAASGRDRLCAYVAGLETSAGLRDRKRAG